ncbi:MAG TPA: alpha/beta fold hydrolase [candidate division Zixibacteria bacterium]|nr:alpha/beta fold hydrolase [candidate division Zixibacteria bacterium]
MEKSRSVEEVKNDIRSRIGHRAPFNYAGREEAEEALAELSDFEGERWAAAWSRLGERWEEKARRAEAAGDRTAARDAFLKAYGYYGIARHPFPSTPGKQLAYRKAREMHAAAARYFEIPLERVAIPFGDREIPGHLRLPSTTPAPLVLHWGGIDNWKEERHTFAERFVKEGWACLVIDSPGTGECPMLASPEAHRVHLAVLDYAATRPEIDPDRIAAVGASFGGYWATKLAHLEPHRLRAAVNWGGGIHRFFQPEWQERSRNADSYLFDLIEARANLFGKRTFEELIEVMPALSLLAQGLLDRPCAPLLLVNGKEDKQVPLEDFYLLLEHGDPKAIRLFPGGHMGNIPTVFETVIPWLHRKLGTRP